MAGERGKLTDLQIRQWVKAGVPLAKADGGGLTFTLSAGGSAGWILRYSFGGRRRELTIGRYPDIGLAEARGIATLSDTRHCSEARALAQHLEDCAAHGTLVLCHTGATMPELQTSHGRLVDLRRHINVHWRHLHPIAPTDRYELWLRAPDGTERKFTVHTREMPARRAHEVSLIITAHRRQRVLALAKWTTIDGVNYARSEPPGLVRVGDVPWLAAGFIGMTARLGDAGMALFVPVAAVVLVGVAAVRWVARQRLAWRVDRAIDLEAGRTAKGPAPLH